MSRKSKKVIEMGASLSEAPAIIPKLTDSQLKAAYLKINANRLENFIDGMAALDMPLKEEIKTIFQEVLEAILTEVDLLNGGQEVTGNCSSAA